MKPRIAPYHRVPKRIIIATPIEIVADNPKNWSNPENVASATPSPPGIMLTAPASDAKLKINVDINTLID